MPKTKPKPYTIRMKNDPVYRRQQYDRLNAQRKAKRDARKAESGKDDSKKGTGICAYIDCNMKLSRYNDTDYCGPHFSILFRKGFIKEKDLY
jgi:hypothetical protein